MPQANDPNIWVSLADDEFDYANRNLELPEENFFAPTCFHFQQAAEKYLKAFILYSGLSFRRVHNLIELLSICSKRDSEFGRLKNEAALLNPFYTNTRYPVHWPMEFTREDAKRPKTAAQKIREVVKSRLKI